jgi:tryptophan 7-halogenase
MPANTNVKTIVIAGGGLAGWMAASTISRYISQDLISIIVIDEDRTDDSLGPFIPALAALPSTRNFHAQFGYDEDAIINTTGGSFSLGTAISGWTRSGKTAFHPFGETGANMGHINFHHLTARLRSEGIAINLADYSLAALCAQTNRFLRPLPDDHSVVSTIDYGLVLDAERYCAMFKQDALAKEITTIYALIKSAKISSDGLITSLETNAGVIAADFFIDCTGPAAKVIGTFPSIFFENWSQWLPCDHVVNNSAMLQDPLPPYTHLKARVDGWCAFHVAAGVQHESMIFHAESTPDQPLSAKAFKSGRRSRLWQGNVLALGAAAAVLDPLSPLTLHLLQSAIQHFVTLLPATKDSKIEAAHYNEVMSAELSCARDFTIMPYKLNGKVNEPFWDACRAMNVPDTLQHKIDLYNATGQIALYDGETMNEADWVAYFDAQDIYPTRYDPAANAIPVDNIQMHFARIRQVMLGTVKQMPFHANYLESIRQ